MIKGIPYRWDSHQVSVTTFAVLLLPLTTAATPLICKTLDSIASLKALTPLNLTSEKKFPTKKAAAEPTRLGPGKPESPWQIFQT